MNKKITILTTIIALVSILTISITQSSVSAYYYNYHYSYGGGEGLSYHDRYQLGFSEGCQSVMHGTTPAAYNDHSPTWWNGFDAGWAACSHNDGNVGQDNNGGVIQQQAPQQTIQKVYCTNVAGNCNVGAATTQKAAVHQNYLNDQEIKDGVTSPPSPDQ